MTILKKIVGFQNLAFIVAANLKGCDTDLKWALWNMKGS